MNALINPIHLRAFAPLRLCVSLFVLRLKEGSTRE
jgi:hypothetical protein